MAWAEQNAGGPWRVKNKNGTSGFMLGISGRGAGPIGKPVWRPVPGLAAMSLKGMVGHEGESSNPLIDALLEWNEYLEKNIPDFGGPPT